MFNKIKHFCRIQFLKAYQVLIEKHDKYGARYIYEDNHSDKLLVVFSGIGDAKYNYMRALTSLKCDKLFVADVWAGNVSYHLLDKGRPIPELATQSIIDRYLHSHKYCYMAALGSSKGGSVALYYGLKNKFNDVFVGACQYRIGYYLGVSQKEVHPERFKSVTGLEATEDNMRSLDNMFRAAVLSNTNSATTIHLMYSNKEHTYDDHIVPLKDDLNASEIKFIEYVYDFPDHMMVGKFFKEFIQSTVIPYIQNDK